MGTAVYTKLPDRAMIRISGADRLSFLQGLITQDIHLLKTQPLIYSCLLTPNGKFLFDFFIFEQGDALVIDCEGGERGQSLLKKLSMYKLRSNVILELHDDMEVYQIFLGNSNDDFKDPRFDGFRAYSKPERTGLVDFSIWDDYRIRHEIPDGSRDMIPEQSFLHESAVIITSAVSYTKGCYMGQELVSRMHHRGLVKKQLKCLNANALPEGAELRSSCNGFGLALIRL